MTFNPSSVPEQRERFTDVWDRLQRAPKEPDNAFRTPTFATVDGDGAPQNRTVVLRAANVSRRMLTIYSDGAADKCTALRGNNQAAFCFWDATERLQVRMVGTTTISEGEQVLEDWSGQSPQAQSLYRVHPLPGQPIHSRSDLSYEGEHRFVRIDMLVERVDVLMLLRSGHERLQAQWMSGNWALDWVAP